MVLHKLRTMNLWHWRFPILAVVLKICSAVPLAGNPIDLWYGPEQKVGNLGDLQADFNVLGHIEDWQQVDQLFWSLNGRSENPMQFRAYRRLAMDGDFNADIPISWLKPGSNTLTLRASLKDGEAIKRVLIVNRESGASPLPCKIRWESVKDLQDVGQVVDGRWEITKEGLRTKQVGYDRLFLIGETHWKDYEIRTSITIHEVPDKTTPLSGGNGLGIIWRFTGHVVGGFRDFPSGQPKWGYQPFGAIGWLRWPNKGDGPPYLQFYPGFKDRATDYGRFPYSLDTKYAIRMRCESLPDAEDGAGVTRYSYKIWPAQQIEPEAWTWSHVQSNPHALRSGGCALVAHHVDATFGDITITEVSSPGLPE